MCAGQFTRTKLSFHHRDSQGWTQAGRWPVMKTHVICGKFLTMVPSYSTQCSSLLPLSFLQKTIVSEFICDDRVMLPSVFRDLLDVEVGSRFPRWCWGLIHCPPERPGYAWSTFCGVHREDHRAMSILSLEFTRANCFPLLSLSFGIFTLFFWCSLME